MSVLVSEYPRDRYGLVRRSTANDIGISDDELAAAVKRADLVRLTRGVYMVAPEPVVPVDHAGSSASATRAAVDPAEKYRLTCLAVATSGPKCDAPLSHQSAAALHGLPLLKPDRSRVHTVTGGADGGSRRSGRHRHSGLLADDEVVVIDGVRVTSLRRTALDVARSGSFAQALTAIDGVLARGVDRDDLAGALAGRAVAGRRLARAAVRYGDARSESVGESWSRAQMIAAGLPTPRLQVEYTVAGGRCRCDFGWDDVLVGEFDGLIKYQGVFRPNEPGHLAVVREKRREDAMRNAGLDVVRWIWADLEADRMVPLLRDRMRRCGLLPG
ncbi:MAG: type IV toxin-antitoxin system AbiEi family antitoxin domain-containing protein [Gordonia sp. (in: high G+C Gram-positive bacteria)]